MTEFLSTVNWDPLVWVLLGIFGGFASVAVVSPRRFAQLQERSNQWVNTNKLVALLDKRVDVDRFFMPHSRLLGVVVLASVVMLAIVYNQTG